MYHAENKGGFILLLTLYFAGWEPGVQYDIMPVSIQISNSSKFFYFLFVFIYFFRKLQTVSYEAFLYASLPSEK